MLAGLYDAQRKGNDVDGEAAERVRSLASIVMAEGRVVDAATVPEILERQSAFREVVYSAAPVTVH